MYTVYMHDSVHVLWGEELHSCENIICKHRGTSHWEGSSQEALGDAMMHCSWYLLCDLHTLGTSCVICMGLTLQQHALALDHDAPGCMCEHLDSGIAVITWPHAWEKSS
jgi:hypothetical protein